MISRRALLSIVTRVLALSVLALSTFAADERGELKQRFEARYPTLLKLKGAGRVGETPEGEVRVVKDSYTSEKIAGDPSGLTIGGFLDLENKDRKRLYELIAKESSETAQEVARQNALRNYNKATPEHFLLIKGGDGKLVWKQKKDL